MGSFGISQIKQLININNISERINRIWKQLITGGKASRDDTLRSNIQEPVDNNLQELSSKLANFRELLVYFFEGALIYQYVIGCTEGEEENIRYYLFYLTNLQDYLKTVPEYLHETVEYKEGVKMFTDGLTRYINLLKFHH